MESLFHPIGSLQGGDGFVLSRAAEKQNIQRQNIVNIVVCCLRRFVSPFLKDDLLDLKKGRHVRISVGMK